MSSTQTDRISGLSTGIAIKAPVRTATTANLASLAALLTVDGVTLVANDRILVKDQTDQTKNGIYLAATGNWTRDQDFDGNRDIAEGTLVLVNHGTTNGGLWYRLTTVDPITIGTSNLTFAVTATPTISSAMAPVVGAASLAAARSAMGVQASSNAAVTDADNSFSADQSIVSTDASAAVGPFLKLHRNSASPAASDLIGAVDFQGKNSTPATKSYARVLTQILDATAATEDAQLEFWTIVAGTLARAGFIGQGLVVGSPTGSDKGAGTLNASDIFKGGVRGAPCDTIIVQDRKTNGTDGQALTANTFVDRNLNTITLNTVGGATAVSTPNLTLPAGTYDVRAEVTVYSGGTYGTLTRLFNTTDAAVQQDINSNDITSTNHVGVTSASMLNILRGRFTIAAQKNLKFQTWTDSGSAVGGKAHNTLAGTGSAEPEVYLQAEFVKVA